MTTTTPTCTIFVECIPGIPNMRLEVPTTLTVEELKAQIKAQLPPQILSRTNISTSGGLSISRYQTVSELYSGVIHRMDPDDDTFMYLNLKINLCLCGGKGGFGHMLKQGSTQGKKKKGARQSESRDLFKTLDGRRVKALKKLKKMEEQMDTMSEVEKKRVREKREKLEKILNVDLEKGVKFEDTQYLDEVERQMQEIRDVMELDGTDESDDASDDTSDSESDSDEEEQATTSMKAKVASFFDDTDDEDVPPPEPLSKKEGKKVAV